MSKMRKRRQKTPTKKVHRVRPRRVWQLQEAKARFSQLVNEVEEDGYHMITKNGHPVAMVISTKEFEKLTKPKKTLLELFRDSPYPEIDIDIERNKDTGRDIDL